MLIIKPTNTVMLKLYRAIKKSLVHLTIVL